jgi:hypothetical protein
MHCPALCTPAGGLPDLQILVQHDSCTIDGSCLPYRLIPLGEDASEDFIDTGDPP